MSMLDLGVFKDKLKHSLEGHVEDPEVDAIPGDYHQVLGIIVSPSFEGMDEGRRQEIVWDRVLRTFDEAERRSIEFIYTNAPSDVAP
jgi:acid stress-induced BolA-like protein IbaG/YrbA